MDFSAKAMLEELETCVNDPDLRPVAVRMLRRVFNEPINLPAEEVIQRHRDRLKLVQN